LTFTLHNYNYIDVISVTVIVFCSFFADFGPLNIASLYKYCCKLNKKLKVFADLTLLPLLHYFVVAIFNNELILATPCIGSETINPFGTRYMGATYLLTALFLTALAAVLRWHCQAGDKRIGMPLD